MTLSQNALTTLAAAKTSLKIPEDDSSRDAILELLIEAMSAAAESYCSRALARRTVSAEPHELCGHKITLDHYPLVSLGRVVVDGGEIALSCVGTDAQAGIVKLPSLMQGTALVDYTAGLCSGPGSAPADIQLAIWKWLEYALSREGGAALTREQLGDYAVSYAEETGAPPPAVRSLLEPYRSERI